MQHLHFRIALYFETIETSFTNYFPKLRAGHQGNEISIFITFAI